MEKHIDTLADSTWTYANPGGLFLSSISLRSRRTGQVFTLTGFYHTAPRQATLALAGLPFRPTLPSSSWPRLCGLWSFLPGLCRRDGCLALPFSLDVLEPSLGCREFESPVWSKHHPSPS